MIALAPRRRRFTTPPFKKYGALVNRMSQFCLQRLPRPSPYDADDLAAEAWIVYHRVAERFDADRGCKFITPFWVGLRNHFAKIVTRERKYGGRVDLGDDGPGMAGFPAPGPSPTARLDGRLAECLEGRISRPAMLAARALVEDGAFAAWETETYRKQAKGSKRMSRVACWLGVPTMAGALTEELLVACGRLEQAVG